MTGSVFFQRKKVGTVNPERCIVNEYEYIYGINPAFEVMRANRRKVGRASISKGSGSGARVRKLLSLLDGMNVPVEKTDKGRLSQLCGSSEHQGVVLRVDPYPYVPFDSLLDSTELVLLDNIEDPQNAGAILRSAEVFGWHSVLMSSRGVPGVYPSVVKASAGATEHLRIAQDHSANDYVKRLTERGFTVIALDRSGREGLDQIKALAIDKPVLVVGGEHQSVGQYILNTARHVVGIPQQGNVRSLNASVAAGIALFALGR